jgi:hypothetical protein
MSVAEELDGLFQQAVGAMDAGEVAGLEALVTRHPSLVRERLAAPGAWLRDAVGGALDGFFAAPYLLWFAAEDPIRTGALPPNIADAVRVLIRAAQREGVESLQEQLDYALRLVGWSTVARGCGVQIPLIDVLMDAGARPGRPDDPLVNGNVEAARHLLHRGAQPTLGAALCLGRWDEVADLAAAAGTREIQFALVLAALNGSAEGVRRALELGADPNAPSADLFSHGTPLHHAVCSGSLATVEALLHAGADPAARDSAWTGTPLGWAEYYEGQGSQGRREEYTRIADRLRAADAPG